jgi:hypothetical protein
VRLAEDVEIERSRNLARAANDLVVATAVEVNEGGAVTERRWRSYKRGMRLVPGGDAMRARPEPCRSHEPPLSRRTCP